MTTRERGEPGDHRRLVVALSLASGVVGLAPVPLVGDLAIGLVRTYLVRSLARRRGVGLSTERAMIVAGQTDPSLTRLGATTALILGLRLAWSHVTRLVLWLLRFDDVARTFLVGTFFDHYCLQHHPGGEISARRASQLQRAIARACSTAREHLVSALFRTAVDRTVRAGTFVPRTLWRLFTAALSQDARGEVERTVEDDPDGFLARVTAAVEAELQAAGEVTQRALCDAFDRAWEQLGPAAAADPAGAASAGGPAPAHQPPQEHADDLDHP